MVHYMIFPPQSHKILSTTLSWSVFFRETESIGCKIIGNWFMQLWRLRSSSTWSWQVRGPGEQIWSSSLKAGRLKAQDEPVLQSEGHQAQENLSYSTECCFIGASQVELVVKNPPAIAEYARDAGLIFGSGRSPGEGNGNLLQYSCLENFKDRGA